MYGFTTGVVVNEHKQVLKAGALRAHERPSNVCMNESPSVRKFVMCRSVRLTRRVCLGACRAPVETPVGERGGSVSSDGRQAAQA
eukprot:918517-Pleurochrysis_carterae.AAC.1